MLGERVFTLGLNAACTGPFAGQARSHKGWGRARVFEPSPISGYDGQTPRNLGLQAP